MDGVLVRYDRDGYKGENPLYMQPGAHYFRNLPPDRNALALIDRLYCRSRYTGDNISTLTSIPMNGLIFNEHLHDKILWNQDWVPYMSIENVLVSVTSTYSKRDVAEFINNRKLTKDDILIDDYNKNLIEWQMGGGTSVKYCNGINSPESFDGPCIHHTDSVDKMLYTLDAAVYT